MVDGISVNNGYIAGALTVMQIIIQKIKFSFHICPGNS